LFSPSTGSFGVSGSKQRDPCKEMLIAGAMQISEDRAAAFAAFRPKRAGEMQLEQVTPRLPVCDHVRRTAARNA